MSGLAENPPTFLTIPIILTTVFAYALYNGDLILRRDFRGVLPRICLYLVILIGALTLLIDLYYERLPFSSPYANLAASRSTASHAEPDSPWLDFDMDDVLDFRSRLMLQRYIGPHRSPQYLHQVHAQEDDSECPRSRAIDDQLSQIYSARRMREYFQSGLLGVHKFIERMNSTMSEMTESTQLYDIDLYMNFAIYLPEIEQHLMTMDGGQDMLREHSGTLLELCMAEKHQSVCLYRRREDSHEIGSQRRNLQVIATATGGHGVCEHWKQATQFEDGLRYIGDTLRRSIYILSTTNDADDFRLVFHKAGQSAMLLLNDL